jgi:hypothetical protein
MLVKFNNNSFLEFIVTKYIYIIIGLRMFKNTYQYADSLIKTN